MRKLALITGGTSGIGLGIAEALLPDFDLALSYASNDEKAEGAKSCLTDMAKSMDLPGAVDSVKIFKLPLTDYHSAEALVGNVREAFDRPISVLVNSAGRVRDGLYMSNSFEEHQSMIDEHLTVPMALCHLVVKEMYKNKFGRMINLSSITARRAKKGQINYTAVKSGIEGLTRSLALETAHRGITVNAIAPGLIETPMTSDMVAALKSDRKAIKSKIPAGYVGQPEDIGGAVAFLCSDAGRYITGQVLSIDGGRSLGEIS